MAEGDRIGFSTDNIELSSGEDYLLSMTIVNKKNRELTYGITIKVKNVNVSNLKRSSPVRG